jgi:hypothetical protein
MTSATAESTSPERGSAWAPSSSQWLADHPLCLKHAGFDTKAALKPK